VFLFSPPCDEHARRFEEALSLKLGRPWHQVLAEALDEYVTLLVLCNPDPPRPTALPWPSQFDAASRLLNLRFRGKHPFLPRRAKQELRNLARDWAQDPAELERGWLQEGIVSTVTQLETPRRIRLGHMWVRNDTGGVAEIRPGDLEVQDAITWIIAKAIAYTKAKALDEPYPRPSTDALTRNLPFDDGRNRRKVQLELQVLPQDRNGEMEPEEVVRILNSMATPTERRLLTLLIEGTDAAQLPTLLNFSSATLRVHRHNLRVKLRRILRPPPA
jgi:hypothetical protein